MEETNVIISKLIQTRAVERVLKQISNQVSTFILLNESYENGEQERFISNLVPKTMSVKRSIEQFVSKCLEDIYISEDEEFKIQMHTACETLNITGSDFVTASQRIEIENCSSASRRYFIRTAKNVVEATLKVFLIAEDAVKRELVQDIVRVKEQLGVLTSVTTMSQLVQVFKELVEAVLLLANKVHIQQLELVNPCQQESIAVSLAILKKSMYMLRTASQTFVKYPNNEQAKSSKEYAIGRVLQCLGDLQDLLENKKINLDETDCMEEQGSFTSNIDKLFDMLSEENRLECMKSESDLSLVVGNVVQESMTVAHMAADEHCTLIRKNCQRVLVQEKVMQEQGKNLLDNPTFEELIADFEDSCDRFLDEIQDLEQHVKVAVLQLTVTTYAETTEPLERLVKAAIKPLLESKPLQEPVSRAMLEPFIHALHVHADRIGQVGRFVAACSDDSEKTRTILSCINHLDSLDPELVPATILCRQDISNHGAMQHLRLLKQEWCDNVRLLVKAIDDTTDSRAFVIVAGKDLRNRVNDCKRSPTLEPAEVAESCRMLIAGARRLATVAKNLISNDVDPILRNRITGYLNHMEKVIGALKAGANCLVNHPEEVSNHQTLHKHCDLLLKVAAKIQEIVHSHVVSPFPSNIRHGQGITDLGREMHLLSKEKDLIEEEEERSHLDLGKAHVDKDKQTEKSAIKSYISELLSSQIKELVTKLTTSAVAGNQADVDLLSNSVLIKANHVTELANSIALYTKTHKVILQETASEINILTPSLLDKAHRVVSLDTGQVESFHRRAEEWANKVSYLEGLIDGVVAKWKTVSDKVVDAAKIADIKLFQAQVQHFEKHKVTICDLVSVANSCITSHNVLEMDTSILLKSSLEYLDDCTTAFIATAAARFKSASETEEYGSQLDHAGREWAVRMFIIVSLINSASVKALLRMTNLQVNLETNAHNEIPKILKTITEETIKWKCLLHSAIESSMSEAKVQENSALMENLDLLVSEMNECSRTMVQSSAPYQTIDKLYAPYRLALLLWQWAIKVNMLTDFVDKLTVDYCLDLEASTLALQSPNETNNNFQKVKAAIIEMIADCDDIRDKSQIRQNVDALDQIMKDLMKLVQKHADDGEQKRQLLWCQRQWACKAQSLAKCLTKLNAPKARQNSIHDIISKLKHQSAGCPAHVSSCKELLAPPQAGQVKCSPLVSRKDVSRKNEREEKKSADIPLKQLYMGPKMKHTQPERPTEKSGWRSSRTSREKSNKSVILHHEAAQWEDEENAIVRIAMALNQQLYDMTLFTKADEENPPQGNIKTKEALISTAKSVASNAENLVKYAKILADYSVDERLREDLMAYVSYVPSIATQLNMLATVKAAATQDTTTEKMLLKNSENLMDAITKMLQAAEAICVQGFCDYPSEGVDECEAIVLATKWKRRLNLHREQETNSATTDELGLRRVARDVLPPSLTQIATKK